MPVKRDSLQVMHHILQAALERCSEERMILIHIRFFCITELSDQAYHLKDLKQCFPSVFLYDPDE